MKIKGWVDDRGRYLRLEFNDLVIGIRYQKRENQAGWCIASRSILNIGPFYVGYIRHSDIDRIMEKLGGA
jgi:hypothetical protein